MKAKTILDAEKKDAIDIATELYALVQQIKDAGQELINRAESMVHPENDLITDFSIVIHFEQHEVPTIDYTTSVVNKVACDRVIYQKGESNVSKI